MQAVERTADEANVERAAEKAEKPVETGLEVVARSRNSDAPENRRHEIPEQDLKFASLQNSTDKADGEFADLNSKIDMKDLNKAKRNGITQIEHFLSRMPDEAISTEVDLFPSVLAPLTAGFEEEEVI